MKDALIVVEPNSMYFNDKIDAVMDLANQYLANEKSVYWIMPPCNDYDHIKGIEYIPLGGQISTLQQKLEKKGEKSGELVGMLEDFAISNVNKNISNNQLNGNNANVKGYTIQTTINKDLTLQNIN